MELEEREMEQMGDRELDISLYTFMLFNLGAI